MIFFHVLPLPMLFAYFISVLYLLYDLINLLKTTDKKLAKRTKRALLVCDLLGMDKKIITDLPKLPEGLDDTFSKRELFDFLEAHQPERKPVVFMEGKIDPKRENIKRTVEAQLTSALNNDPAVYEESYNIFIELVNMLYDHEIFGPLLINKQLIPVFKGGLAARFVLLSLYPERRQEIEECFGLGGDNDTTLMLDPELEDFDYLKLELSSIVEDYLQSIDPCKLEKTYKIACNIKSIKVEVENNPIELSVELSEKEDFSIVSKDILVLGGIVGKYYVSRNDLIEFTDLSGKICSFSLIRIKFPFLVGDMEKRLSGEFLDIAIPGRKEEKYLESFKHFKNGEYMLRGVFKGYKFVKK